MVLQIKCGTTERRLKVKESLDINGIDYLEVYTSKGNSDRTFRLLIVVYFFKSNGLAEIKANNISITGGVRVKDIRTEWVSTAITVINDVENDDINNITKDLIYDEKKSSKQL